MDDLLLALLFSKLRNPSLDEFQRLQELLKSGARLPERDFLESSFLLESVVKNYQNSFFQKWEAELLKAQERGIKFTYPGKSDYPRGLSILRDPPYFLSYLGQPIWLERAGFAIVGSREPGRLSEMWCEQELPFLCSTLPLAIISGGARGVDQIAHRICLRMGKPTVALLPSGLNEVYPSNFSNWLGPIVESGGAFMSEFSPDTKMQKHFFQRRNRLIAGLSICTLIVEARRKSGTMLTARETLDQNKPLFVLPSHPLDTGNQGALDLLCEGATPVRDAQDLIIFLSADMRGCYNPNQSQTS